MQPWCSFNKWHCEVIQDTHTRTVWATHTTTYGQGHVELGSSFPKVRVGCALWWKSFTDWIAWCNLEMVKTAETLGWHRALGLRPVQYVCVCICICVYEWERERRMIKLVVRENRCVCKGMVHVCLCASMLLYSEKNSKALRECQSLQLTIQFYNLFIHALTL